MKRGENPAHESESARVPADPARPARGARHLTWARGGWPWALGACRASGCPSQAPTSMPRAQKLGKPSSGWRPETRGVRATWRQTDPRPQDGSTRILAAAKRAAHGSEHARLPTGGRFRVPGNVGPARVARCGVTSVPRCGATGALTQPGLQEARDAGISRSPSRPAGRCHTQGGGATQLSWPEDGACTLPAEDRRPRVAPCRLRCPAGPPRPARPP